MICFLHCPSDIVGHHYHGNFFFSSDLPENIIKAHGNYRIKTGYRFIQNQQRTCGTESPGQQHPLLLASGKLPVTSVSKAGDFQKFKPVICQFFQFSCVESFAAQAVETSGQHHLTDAGWKISLNLSLLRQVADLVGFQAPAVRQVSRHRLLKAQQALDKRGFSGTILANYRKIISFFHIKRNVSQYGSAFIGKSRVFAGQKAHQFSASFNTLTLCSMRLT